MLTLGFFADPFSPVCLGPVGFWEGLDKFNNIYLENWNERILHVGKIHFILLL